VPEHVVRLGAGGGCAGRNTASEKNQGVTPKRQRVIHGDAGQTGLQAISQKTARGICEVQPHGHLARPFAHHLRDHAVQSDGRETLTSADPRISVCQPDVRDGLDIDCGETGAGKRALSLSTSGSKVPIPETSRKPGSGPTRAIGPGVRRCKPIASTSAPGCDVDPEI
jgi:hypothetical protein